MYSLKLLSNGFFESHNVDIDFNEEVVFNELENNNTFNVVINNYNFNINDLAILKAVNGENILKEFTITEEQYMYFAENHYIEYSRVNDILKIIINIYDFDKFIDKDLLEFLEKFGRSIEIIINTEKERNIIFEKLNNYFKIWNYESIEDFLDKEYYNI